MVEGGLPGQTGAIFHFRPYLPISGEGKGLRKRVRKIEESLDEATKLTPFHVKVVAGRAKWKGEFRRKSGI